MRRSNSRTGAGPGRPRWRPLSKDDPLRGLAARGASPTAFGQRCIPSGCVAPRSNIPDILTRRALPAGRIAALGATPDLHHGLLVGASRVAPAQTPQKIIFDTDFVIPPQDDGMALILA